MPVPVVNQVGKRIIREPFGTERTVGSTRSASVWDGAVIENNIGTGTGFVQPTPTQIVVNKSTWVALKEESGRAIA